MKKLALTAVTACLLAAPAMAAVPTPDAALTGPVLMEKCPGKPPVSS